MGLGVPHMDTKAAITWVKSNPNILINIIPYKDKYALYCANHNKVVVTTDTIPDAQRIVKAIMDTVY